jgi:hypothetical protein
MKEWFVCSAAWFGTVGQWVAGMITLLAVLVAIFKDAYFDWWRRPILDIRILGHAPDCAKALVYIVNKATGDALDRADCYWLRLWVSNVGRRGAEQVQVYLASLSKQGSGGAYQPVPGFLPMNLLWAHSRPGEPEVFVKGIASTMGRHCDLAHVVEPAKSEAFGADHAHAVLGQCTAILDLEAPPAIGSARLIPGTYRLELWVAASNASRITRTVELTLRERWSDDAAEMFGERFTARILHRTT